jgi:AcrR family transcriptional regulator
MEARMKIDLTREKLRNATRKLMSECGSPPEVTSRAIAKEAGVQLAMINYCFGSREALIFEVFQTMSSGFIDENPELTEIMNSTLSPKAKLKKMYVKVTKFLLDNQSFSRAVTKYVLLNRDLSKQLNSLPFVRAHYAGRKSDQEMKLISYELSSIVQLAVYRHEAIRDFCGIDLLREEDLEKYIGMQIDLFLAE